MRPCPRCGSDRLKRAPLLLLAVAEPIVGRRRYRCPGCGWTGWKHRLKRLPRPSSKQAGSTPGRKAVWFFVIALTLVVLASGMIIANCQGAEPRRQEDSMSGDNNRVIARAAAAVEVT